MITFDFHQQKVMSERPEIKKAVYSALKGYFPELLQIHHAHLENDKRGIDFFLEFPHGKIETLDVKIRKADYALRGDVDNVCIELTSNMEAARIGWTFDDSKLTDWVLFYWEESERHSLHHFRQLRAVAAVNETDWRKRKKTARQKTQSTQGGSYTSESLFISDRDLWAATYRKFSYSKPVGTPTIDLKAKAGAKV